MNAYLLLKTLLDRNDNFSDSLYKKLYWSNMFDKIDIGSKYGIMLLTHILRPLKTPSDTMSGFITNKRIINSMKTGIKFLFNIKNTPFYFIVHKLFICFSIYNNFIMFYKGNYVEPEIKTFRKLLLK